MCMLAGVIFGCPHGCEGQDLVKGKSLGTWSWQRGKPVEFLISKGTRESSMDVLAVESFSRESRPLGPVK